MVKKIAFTGGKGGTGKTLIAVNLAIKLQNDGYKVLLLDCDTENPNSNILLGKSIDDKDVIKKEVNIFIPTFDESKCTKCGKCQTACYRHAILQLLDQFPSVLDHMCSGCRTGERICPENAILEGSKPIGSTYFMKNIIEGKGQVDLFIGELLEGEAVSALIVEYIFEVAAELMNEAEKSGSPYDIVVIDTSPGAHCDVEHSLENADEILCVTEPTPFGAHDLRRILDLLNVINKSGKVILNRSDLTDYRDQIFSINQEYDTEIIGEIPISQEIIEDYAQGKPFVNDPREFLAKTMFDDVYHVITTKLFKIQGGK